MPKISALTLGATIDGANDLFAFVDVSDTSQAPTGTTKKAVFNSIPTQNIYNTSSSLTAPRVVTMSGNLLEFREGTALMAIDAANFGVALGNNAVNASAILDISSSSKGILIPRMTTTERNAITVGASQDSLLIYNETTNQYEYYEHATTSWTSMGGDTLYTANGTIGSTRTVSQGSNTLTFEQTEGATGFRWRNSTTSRDYAIMNTTANGSGLIIEGDDDTAVGTRQDQAILELISTTKGIYIPRMLTTQRDAITVGASQNSLLIFNTNTNQYEWYNHGTGWVALGGGGADTGNILDTDALTLTTTKTHTITNTQGLIFQNSDGSPVQFFQLQGDATTGGRLIMNNTFVYVNQAQSGARVHFASKSTDTWALFLTDSSANALFEAKQSNGIGLVNSTAGTVNVGQVGAAARLHIRAGSVGNATIPLRVDTNALNNRILVDSSGNVGIHRTPAVGFDVQAVSRFRSPNATAGTQIIDIENNGGTSFFTITQGQVITMTGTTGSRFALGTTSAGNSVVRVRGDVAQTDVASFIDSSSNDILVLKNSRDIITHTGASTEFGIGGTNSSGTFMRFGGSTTAKSQIRFTAGSAPTSPVDGDWWFDGTNLNIRISGVTRTVNVT